jgi:hypothetical protein
MAALAVLNLAAIALSASALSAQPSKRWQEIGETSTGNKVYVDPKSISTKDSIITATVRVVYAKPSDTPKGPITGSRAVAMFNCASKKVAVKETIIWHDEAKGTMYEKRTPKIPGYGPVFTSNFSGVALKYLCENKGPSKEKK